MLTTTQLDLFAGIPVADYAAALRWYERLLGAPPTFFPHDTEAVWAAAHVDEDWNMELWGRDEMALARRAARFAEMQAAATVVALLSAERLSAESSR